MSEYWKSQPKKFCDFCKCWITDNKASRDFHEKGKRHQENVKNKIEELKKKGFADAKKKEEEDGYMQQMEKAALDAFKKDLANNPELAKQYNVKLKPEKEKDLVYEGPSLPGPDYVPPPEEEEQKEATPTPPSENGEWYEAMSDMGYPYYWNTVTGESIWVAPEKYVSLSDQGLAPSQPDNSTATNSSVKQENKQDEKPPVISKVEDIPLPPGVENIPLPGETTQPPESSDSDSSEEEVEEEEECKQDRSARGVYGTWERIREQEQEQIDLQLPTVESNVEIIPIPLVSEEPKVKFKEKRVSLGPSKGNENVTFKKRKLGSGARNVRRRGNDD